MSLSSSLYVSLVALALASGCWLQAKDTAPQGKAQLVKAADGGYVCTDDDLAHILIAPNSLAADTTITIAPAAPPDAVKTYALVGQGYDFGPNGTHFAKKSTIILHYDDALLPKGTPAQQIGIVAVSDGNKVELLPDVAVDTAHHTVAASTTHFTWFAPVVVPAVQLGGPDGTPWFAIATASASTSVSVWVGPNGWIRTDANPYATTAPQSLWLRVDTLGALPNQRLRVEQTLEDPGGAGTPWDRITTVFAPLTTMPTDASGVVMLAIDGHMLQSEIDAITRSAPGYPSGRVHLRIYAPQPIDLDVSFALHPQAH